MYLTILDYTNGRVIIIKDPFIQEEDANYDDWILETYGKIEYYFIVHNNLEVNI